MAGADGEPDLGVMVKVFNEVPAGRRALEQRSFETAQGFVVDRARAIGIHELEKIVGAGGGGASVTKIYLELGKELEKEVQRLQSAQDPRLAEVLKSFETFLEDMFNRKEGHDFSTLIWVAETYRALGDGLEKYQLDYLSSIAFD